MKLFHVDDFKCMLCKEWFNPPYNLPYLLKCTHSICSKCLNTHLASNNHQVICSEDYQVNRIDSININTATKRALERLTRQHKNYNDNALLNCIETLTHSLEDSLGVKQKESKDLLQLIDRIFAGEIIRLKGLQQKIKKELNKPKQMVSEWKQKVRNYLCTLKNIDRQGQAISISNQMKSFIEGGRKIKSELTQYQQTKFDDIAASIITNPSICFANNFKILEFTQKINCEETIEERKTMKNKEINHKLGQNKQKHRNVYPNQFEFNQEQFVHPMHQFQTRTEMSRQKQVHINRSNKENEVKNNKYRNTTLANSFKLFEYQSVESPEKETLREHHSNYNTKKILRSYNKKNDKNDQNLLQSKKPVVNTFQNGVLDNIRQSITSQSYQKNLLIYSLGDETENEKEKSLSRECEDLLLTERENNQDWELGNHNFLKQYTISSHAEDSEEIEVKKREYYNCEKEKNNYIRRMQLMRVEEAKNHSELRDGSLSLINFSLQDVDIRLYLECFDWNDIETIKMVNTNINDYQFNQLLNFILRFHVTTLILSGNNLDQITLDALLNFLDVNKSVKNVCLLKNNINVLKGNSKTKINLLKEKGVNLYI